MKRIGTLFERLADFETLSTAAAAASKGKRERRPVRDFLSKIDFELAGMVQDLRSGRYRFGAYQEFVIRDPKSRRIHAPSFRDRVLHHCIVAVAGPVLERGAMANSYACRKGRGQHAALRQAQSWVQKDSWFLKIDVRKYYDSVGHQRLMSLLHRRFRESRLLDLFWSLISSYRHSPGLGLPIGALTSQYFGNFFLDAIDHAVVEKCRVHRYLRYMDDLLLFGNHDEMNRARQELIEALKKIGLSAKNGGILNQCSQGVPYLGFVLYPDRVRLNCPGRRRLRHRVKQLEGLWLQGRISDAELQARGEALYAHARFGDDLEWRRMVTGFSKIWEGQESKPGAPGRLVEQHGHEVPLGVSQQEEAG